MIRISTHMLLRPLLRTPTATTTAPRILSRNAIVRPSAASPLRVARRPFHNTPRFREAPKPKDSAPPKSPAPPKEKPAQGLSAKLKQMSKEYGWTALGVYLALSVLDYPFCFLLVRIVGTEKIGAIEHWVVSNAKKVIPESVKDWYQEYTAALKQAEKENLGNDEISEHVEMATWGVEEATAKHHAEASLGTQLALAYAVHKTFIFVRVPLTAAILPKVVKILRGWGWKIGRKSK